MDSHYSLVAITLLTTGFYLLTFILSKFELIEKLTHQRIWNLILFITFIITAVLGILFAIQVNYKLELKWIKNLLIWHVNFGIGLVVTGLFHLILNFRFYIDMLKDNFSRPKRELSKKEKLVELKSNITLNSLRYVIIVLGITTIAMQIVMLREFMNVFYGNELVIGIILCNWMLLTGLGARIGINWSKIKNLDLFISLGMIILLILPFVIISLLNLMKNLIFPVGSMVGIIEIFYTSFILLLPFCLLSGFMFTLLARVYSDTGKKNLIAEVYSWESIGSIIGGVVFNIILILFLETFESLSILLLINLIVILFSLRAGLNLPIKIFSILAALLFVGSVFNYNIDLKVKNLLFPDQDLLFYSDTPYGSIAVTQQDEQLNCYSDNVLLFTSNDAAADEEAVHYGMVQHQNPKNILMISGSRTGILNEIFKYKVDRVDLIEQNKNLIEIEKKYFGLSDSEKLNIINVDPRNYAQESTIKYDVILINVPNPVTAQLNRFYTIEFFTSLKNILNDGGIVSFGILSATDYLSSEAQHILSSISVTASSIFKNVILIPGNKIYLIASEGELSRAISEQIRKKGIDNLYVNQYYIDDHLLIRRSNLLQGSINHSAELNRDFTPVAYYQQLEYWLSYFRINVWVIIAGFVILLLSLLRRSTPLNLGVFTVGFSASGFQILLLISFQILCGFMYEMIGLLITAFFAGLALGAKYYDKLFQRIGVNSFILVQLCFLFYAAILPLLFNLLNNADMPIWILYTIYLLIGVDIGAITGALFAIATRISNHPISKAAAEIYSFDLIGSAVGALIITAYLIPLLGLETVSFLIGIVNLLGILALFIFRNQYQTIEVKDAG